ncbi:MAG TPA: glycosyltransferase family 4 protein [Actinomycetales bacterium]
MPLRLGFACHWDESHEATWSGTPWRLREALAARPDQLEVVDVGVQLPLPVRKSLRLASVRRHDGQWRSLWRQSAPAQALVERSLRAGARDTRPDVCLQLQDLGTLPVPSMVMQDLSYALLLEHLGPQGVPHFRTLGRRRLDALQARQERVYASAARLLPMSAWLASSLVASGVDADRVRVVPPGTSLPPAPAPAPRTTRPRTRLLFVGRDFDTKAGAQVVAAFELLRRQALPGLTLTVAGPPTWPLRREPPEGATFLGAVPRTRVLELFDAHDLFVMPSHFEGFGIAFVEALSRGLPCIGRRACAMPEIIREGVGGYLVDDDAPAALGAVIARALEDESLYEQCLVTSDYVRDYYSWHRAAGQVADIAAEVVR